jgi:hypothetical protein
MAMVVVGVLLALQTTEPKPTDVQTLVERARAARFQQDSTLASYQAIARQRMSASIGVARGLVGAVGRPRLAARLESVARVGWHHEFGAWAELLGARSVAPIVGELDMGAEQDAALVLPYYPGKDRLWPFSQLEEALHDHDEWISHPLNAGADSVYEYSVGDSLIIRLPDGNVVRVRELRIRPRRPASRLVVGSLWVDIESGSLVRAAYRPSLPMDLWPLLERQHQGNQDEALRKLGPYTGIVREVIIDHALFEQRFWLPRTRVVNAEGTARGGRVTVSIEQTFRYERVSGLAPGQPSAFVDDPRDVDPRTGRIRGPRWYGVENRRSRCRPHGDTSSRWSPDSLMRDDRLSVMRSEGIRFQVLLPCRESDLVNSPELPESIFDSSEELFTDTDLNVLRKDVEGALGLSSQAKWEPLSPTLHYGFTRGLVRYNRIEGLSVGGNVERVLGKGYTVSGTARLGVADVEPNAELSIQRSNVRTEWSATAYRRLTAANDWGDPFGFGSSVLSAVFARDDGFYYRTAGAEVTMTHRRTAESPVLSLRVFGERHDVARVETQESLARLISGRRFPPNIAARSDEYFGGVGAVVYAWGSDPRGTQLSGAVRAEGAASDSAYGRFMMEHTVLQGLGFGVRAAMTVAAGTSAGALPPQRLWYVGGPYTVRGYRAGEMVGDAFWMGRAELSKGRPLIKPAVFVDVGWAGSRLDWDQLDRRIIGVGAGASMLDGLVRLDVTRGLDRDKRWRLDAYLEVR